MKYLILVLFFQAIVNLSFAECGTAIVVYPENTSIDQNGHILIEALGWERAHNMLKELDSTYPVYLNSKSGKIRLIKKDYKKGQKDWSQVLLVPESKLKFGETYVLVIDKLSLNDKGYIDISKLYRQGDFRSAKWTVNKRRNAKNNFGDHCIESSTSEVIQFGCGPLVQTTFNLNTSTLNTSIVKAEVYDQDANFNYSYYLVVSDSKVVIGHDMCSGPFSFKKGKEYRIRFADNYTDKELGFTNWIKCENPWDGDAKN